MAEYTLTYKRTMTVDNGDAELTLHDLLDIASYLTPDGWPPL